MRMNPLVEWGVFVLGIVAGVVGVIVAPPDLRNWSIVAFVLLFGGGLAWKWLSSRQSIRVEFTNTIEEFEAAWNFGNGVYKSIRKHYPDEAIVREWWQRYPKGVLRLFDPRNQRLLAYLSIWPISREVFTALKSGGMEEDQLEGGHIETAEKEPFRYWYIADVCKKRPHGAGGRYPRDLHVPLIAGGLRLLARSNALADTFELIAFAATRNGEKLLKDSHFTKVDPTVATPVVNSIWIRVLSRKALTGLLKRYEEGTDAARAV